MQPIAQLPSPPARFWNGWPAAAALLFLFYAMGLTASRHFCATADETAHLTAGYRYWQTKDFQLQPENGNLPQRFAALPILLGNFHPVPIDIQDWNIPNVYYIGDRFFYHAGNDPDAMLLRACAAIGLFSLFTGLLIYAWSRHLFGPAGGILSLILFAFSPLMLSHGFLITSDAAATLFFLASLAALWKLLHNVTILTLLASAFALAALALSKFSAPLIIPIALAMLLIRLAQGSPLPVRVLKTKIVPTRGNQAAIFTAAAILLLAIIIPIIWASYCFRYDAYMSPRPKSVPPFLSGGWDWAFDWHSPFVTLTRFARNHRLLPEAYLYGFIHTLKESRYRQSFLAGNYHNEGSPWFFPYCALIKTPLALFAILFLAALAAIKSPSIRRGLYLSSPLWLFLLAYWAMAIPSHLNIGFRHLMPTYPILFILAGAAAKFWSRRARSLASIFLTACVLWFIAESLWIRPYYLEYFNELIGGPSHAYTRLVDSSLDWGQDLPALKQYLADHHLADAPGHRVYLSYFGPGSPQAHHLPVTLIHGFGTKWEENNWDISPWQGGTYCISATLYQGIYNELPGPWTQHSEQHYQQLRAQVAAASELQARSRQEYHEKYEHGNDLVLLHESLNANRISRLCAYLRNRKPTTEAGYSILIFQLSDDEVKAALDGPPAQLLDRGPFGF